MDLLRGVLDNNKRALARAISLIENGAPEAADLLSALYRHAGRAHIVGVTGAPGTGKSTLVSQLARAYRRQNVRVGVLAVDPTSPFSGGALLGDRIRMRDLAGDGGVFIRSMATRGALGGLSAATFDAALVLDAAGYETILIETVGVGQDEVEIARLADTVIVVEAPGLGDDVQANKAGLMEIADIFVVNKADREGAGRTARFIEMALGINAQPWQPPVCQTIATQGVGIEQVMAHLERRRAGQRDRASIKTQVRVERRLTQMIREKLFEQFLADVGTVRWRETLNCVVLRQLSPQQALARLLADRSKSGRAQG